jgi:hypothetical protein
MVTQSLRGLRNLSPYHWRGERPDLESFNVAFDGLLGGRQLRPRGMGRFGSFLESIVYPPSAGQAPDRSRSDAAQRGFDVFHLTGTIGSTNCVSCHQLETEEGEPTFGSNRQVFELLSGMTLKVPQLRGLPDRVIFSHDGFETSLRTFLDQSIFVALTSGQRDDLAAFFGEFESETMPSVGVQRTLHKLNCDDPETLALVELLMDRASREIRPAAGEPEIELQATGYMENAPGGGDRVVSLLYRPSLTPSSWEADTTGDGPHVFEGLRQMACSGDAVLTFTAVPAGTGIRSLDRDGDGLKSGDEELVHGTLPGKPDSDHDGLTDGDEVLTTGTDPLVADSDGDGLDDSRETEDGTDPLDSLSGMHLSVESDGSAATLTWTTDAGLRYVVEAADVRAGGFHGDPSFAPAYTSPPEDESPRGTESHTDDGAVAAGFARFYSVKVAP